MNASLLAVGGTFAGTAGSGPASSKLAKTKNAEHFSRLPADNLPSTNAPGTAKTDNTFIGVQTKPAGKPPQEFGHTLHKKVTTEVSRKTGAGTKPAKQGLVPRVAAQPETVQIWLAQYSQNVEHGKEGIATKMQPKAGYELAQLLAGFGAGELPPGLGKTAKAAENKLLPVDKNEIQLKTIFSNASKGPLAVGAQPNEGGNADGRQISTETLLANKGLTNQQSSKELLSEVLVDADSKTATPGGKPAIALASNASGVQKATTLTGKTAATDEKPTIADKPTGSGGQKTPALNTGFPQAEGRYSDPHQKVTLGLEKPVTVAEEPTDNKAVRSQTLSKLSVPNDKMSRPAGNSLSGDSTLRHLNVTELHASAGQTKGNNSPMSNNGNSANPDFEQVPPANSAQTPITEVFSDASTEVTKIVDGVFHGRPFPAVGEQILESIHSSLRQGDNQIAIRLNPPELGKVFVKFQEQQDQITGLLEVDKIQTRYEIEQALPQIIRTLQDAGIQIKRFEVVLTDQPEQQLCKDQSTHDGSFQHYGFAEGGKRDSEFADEWLAEDSSYQDITEPQMFVTSDSINMLV